MVISKNDKAILRKLAQKQLEYANSEKNKSTINEWYRHHRFEKGKPMLHLELETFSNEVIEPRLKCSSELARNIERTIYSNFLNHEIFDDDKPVADYFPIKWQTYFNLFDIKIELEHANDSEGRNVGHQFKHVIHDIKKDYDKLKKSTYGVDRKSTEKYEDIVQSIIGDILPTKKTMGCLYAVPTQKLVHLMGMQTMFMSMYDYPELFKKIMSRVADDYIEYFKWLQKEQLILPTNSDQFLGQGSWCFTDELPGYDELKKKPLHTEDVWGFLDSQETVGVSPDMFNEFIFPCYKRIGSIYGLLSYGCCEPVDKIWDKNISKFDNLRKVSISPWCDEEYMGNALKGKKIVYHRKPTPNILGVDKTLDETKLREHIRKTLHSAKGCQLEIAQRDVYTIHNDEKKAKRYVSIIKDEIEKNWE